MTELPSLTGQQIIKALQKEGFKVVRQKGSHVRLKHSDGRVTTVPVHRGEEIDQGLLRKILRDVELKREKFLELLEK